ncbi:JmjC domain-containing protein [Streptomyces lavendulae]|uniref:JmjC domain-containing protein n=1 Tax=Streptomyces lavendulae TaxID=1914 RepID=UPI003675D6F6
MCRNQRSACSVRYARRTSGLLDRAQRLQSLAAVRGRDPLRPDVEAPAKPETPPLAEVVLQAGDMLYVPPGWWHAVAATEGWSLHRAAGVRPDPGELHTSVRPALEALASGARLTFGELAERSGLTVEQIAALSTELVSKDAAAVSQPR